MEEINAYKLNISMIPESIVNAIRFFELEFGETYLEYHDIFVDGMELMRFALGKGYISQEKYSSYISNGGIEDSFELLFGEDEEYDTHCILYEDPDKCYDTQYEESLLVYGELICSKIEHFNQFISEYSSKEGNLKYIEVNIV